MTRFLGIDYGTKRIGLAVGDDDTSIASPIETVAAKGATVEQARAVLAVADQYAVDAFVLGLPLNMDGTESKQSKLTRQFGTELERVSSKPVHYVDERLSSRAADELLQPAELTYKKKKAIHDAVAAQVILQEFLDAAH